MLRIEPQIEGTKNPSIDSKKLQKGVFRTIILLTEKDLQSLKYLDLLCGVAAELIVVPRELTEEEYNSISMSIFIGFEQIGNIVVLT